MRRLLRVGLVVAAAVVIFFGLILVTNPPLPPFYGVPCVMFDLVVIVLSVGLVFVPLSDILSEPKID